MSERQGHDTKMAGRKAWRGRMVKNRAYGASGGQILEDLVNHMAICSLLPRSREKALSTEGKHDLHVFLSGQWRGA